ncbi:antitermination protein NusG [Pedobacter psychrophilus]|uniref:Antitermination protein NusG n=1 Tax=Pedobacter psychrophilus TaxID=1826909 RepID=A0A179DC42_9SPHI|nr:UpxY family transcription antiterminator [Pedobacter psychrophilus]OAQ38616.1 antitermination protein NusG [Pedobacter psychrophilus]
MNKIDETYRWYPIYTLPRAEKKTHNLLEKKGINTYLPLYKTLKQWSDRRKWVEEVLFKSYLFVYISHKEYDLVIQSYGVVRFIHFSGKAAFIPDKQIEILKNYLSGEQIPELTFEDLAAGQKVKIISGKLKGYDAELVSWQQQQRLVLRIDALGQSLLLRISAADVEVVY